MRGIYGDILNHFPELKRGLTLWNGTDKTSAYRIICIYFDDNMQGMHARYISKGNTAIEIQDQGVIYVGNPYDLKVKIGDYFYHPIDKALMRVTKHLGYDFAGGYAIFEVSRVTGSNQEHTEKLDVKEAYFA